MSRESPTYYDRLPYNREKAAKMFPGVEEFNLTQTAAIIGREWRYVANRKTLYGVCNGFTTIEKITRAQCRER